eukprot:CAMPEP_0119414650 /NCGR_PEP_ID=MMETSP1335-20130426/7106_1 /TAXON_ID=259385 /ORGANISM="Chrysoculter rhomboideus, Strain RCC1486" /LENGTH=69 /DNA_ID=CAMNT_0007439535 /DNA_START=287 /DNA_END=496 /DNA_ORIENTATION=-
MASGALLDTSRRAARARVDDLHAASLPGLLGPAPRSTGGVYSTDQQPAAALLKTTQQAASEAATAGTRQ